MDISEKLFMDKNYMAYIHSVLSVTVTKKNTKKPKLMIGFNNIFMEWFSFD
jgi:hypothetical protein